MSNQFIGKKQLAQCSLNIKYYCPMKTAIENYMVVMSNTIIDKLRACIEKYMDEYNMTIGNMNMFFTLRRNVRMDLVYYRELIETHWMLCKSTIYKVEPSDVLEHYHRLLVDVEQQSFIQIIKIVEPWFALSKAEKEKRGKELQKLVKIVLKQN